MEVKKTAITRSFDTGAVRGDDRGRGKPSLLPFEAISMVSRCFNGSAWMPMLGVIEVTKVYEAGAAKYEDRNWEQGMNLSAYVDSAYRHFAKFQQGETDEPHCGQFAWNLCCLLQTYIWVADGVIGKFAPIMDLPRIKVDIEALRDEPLPIICERTMGHHASMAVGCLNGFCYGKHPINLPSAVAHSLVLTHLYVGVGRGDFDQNKNDMHNVRWPEGFANDDNEETETS